MPSDAVNSTCHALNPSLICIQCLANPCLRLPSDPSDQRRLTFSYLSFESHPLPSKPSVLSCLSHLTILCFAFFKMYALFSTRFLLFTFSFTYIFPTSSLLQNSVCDSLIVLSDYNLFSHEEWYDDSIASNEFLPLEDSSMLTTNRKRNQTRLLSSTYRTP